MRSSPRKLVNVPAVGYGKRVDIPLPTGSALEEIVLKLTDVSEAQALGIELLLNGNPVHTTTCKHLKDVHKHNGKTAEAGRYRIGFRNKAANNDVAQMVGILQTLPTDILILRLTIGAATSAQVTAGTVPGLDGYVVESKAAGGRAIIPKVFEQTIDAGGSGDKHWTDFPKGALIQQMYIDSEYVTNFKVLINGVERFNLSKEDNDANLIVAKKLPLTGMYVFNPVAEGFALADALQTAGASKLEFVFTTTQACQIPVTFHVLESAAGATADAGAVLTLPNPYK